MTPFSLLIRLTGLSHQEASDYLNVRLDTVRSWSTGRNPCRASVLNELRALAKLQDQVSAETIRHLSEITKTADLDAQIEIGYPVDNAEAQALGWSSCGAWFGMMAKVLAGLERPIVLVPRGSTPATAKAIEARAGLEND